MGHDGAAPGETGVRVSFALSVGCGGGVSTVGLDDSLWSSPDRLPEAPPIFLASASCVCRSSSRMSSMVKPYHSSCHVHAWRWARTMVFLNAAYNNDLPWILHW